MTDLKIARSHLRLWPATVAGKRREEIRGSEREREAPLRAEEDTVEENGDVETEIENWVSALL